MPQPASIPTGMSLSATGTASSHGGMDPRISRAKVARSPSLSDPPEELPYRVELWLEDRDNVERILARAVSATLAHAIFKAAQVEHPERRITLSNTGRIIADTAG